MKHDMVYFDKDTTKFPQELCKVLDEVAHPCPELGCVRQLGSYVVCPEDPLASPELSLGLVAESYGYLFLTESLGRRILHKPERIRILSSII